VADYEGTPAATKDIHNLIDRHVITPGCMLLLFASADVKLDPGTVLTRLRDRGCSVHCHVANDWHARMEREGAKVGDVTVTLAWDTEDDLDLHVICPNKAHISYSTKCAAGGYLDVDMNASPPYHKEPVENVFFGDAEKGIEAEKGDYRVFVQNFAYHGPNRQLQSPPVPWKVRLVMNGETQEFTGTCTGERDASDVTACEFTYNGRTIAAPEKSESALGVSDLVRVTASEGETLDALSQLMAVSDQHKQIELVRDLTHEEEEEKGGDLGPLPPPIPEVEGGAAHDAALAAAAAGGDGGNEKDDEDSAIVAAAAAAAAAAPEEKEEAGEGATGGGSQGNTTTNRAALEITSRDRLYLSLSKLPVRFHQEVALVFGGPTLLEITAATLAKRLVSEGMHIQKLREAGYPGVIVEKVKHELTTFGV